ncbi:DNA-directed RNA polymerase subunit K [Halobaculum gomorrense]|uniref:DNA-directed RNA polymerase subunit Rpo6 n=1 Tax=Halobaculum gomorrense TaxID=43928 RepID=A0A1M5U4Y3_9EURY|nr:DNA-directed RNA polymerase subunit K [Halobaculum gomorrense]SHH58077.1 DNA-directed RNA polymerase, subunit K [Halobaculum gomorrense]
MSGNLEYNRYEKARILGARALQLAYGAPALIESEQSEPILIAAEEYDAGVLPFTVRREGK